MPNNDFITKLLEIEDILVEKIETSSTNITISFKLARKDYTCPRCGAITNKVHDYRISEIKDSPIQGKALTLRYNKRRYKCECCNKNFYEKFNLVAKGCRITTRLSFLAIHLLKNVQSVSSVAKQVGISPSSVFRRLKDINYPKPSALPEVLSIDEFRGNAGGEKFQGILTSPKKHAVFDILPSRAQYKITEYLLDYKDRKNVKYFVMDMNQVYRDISNVMFPNAMVVIDKFHVVRYATWALENVRKRVQKNMHPSKRKYFKRSRRLLLAHYKQLNNEQKQMLEVMLSQSHDLAQAYYLKELFYDFMNANSRNEAIPKLKKFINSAQVSHLEEFKSFLTTLANWGEYILNAFDCPYTNGFTEGMNNKIKVIKRNGYGYRNFENFRNRILLTVS